MIYWILGFSCYTKRGMTLHIIVITLLGFVWYPKCFYCHHDTSCIRCSVVMYLLIHFSFLNAWYSILMRTRNWFWQFWIIKTLENLVNAPSKSLSLSLSNMMPYWNLLWHLFLSNRKHFILAHEQSISLVKSSYQIKKKGSNSRSAASTIQFEIWVTNILLICPSYLAVGMWWLQYSLLHRLVGFYIRC